MSYLQSLGLSTLNINKASDISEYFWLYNEIDKVNDMRVDKEQKKKRILSTTYQFLSGMFDLEYDHKLIFNGDSQDGVYIEGITKLSYDEAFYKLYSYAFYKYLAKIHTLKGNKVNSDIFHVVKLAYLNNDKEVLIKLINNTYIELSNEYSPLSVSFQMDEITQEDINRLEKTNQDRLKIIKERVLSYSILDNLTLSGIKKLYTCFTSDIFSSLNKEEKVKLCNLLYNYFFFEKVDMSDKYDKIVTDNYTNKQALALVIDNVQIPGKTLNIMKKNKDRVKDVLSGVPTIYENESKKENLFILDDLIKLANVKKK